MTRLIDMTGQKVGRLFVTNRGPRTGGHSTWIVRCDCGTTKLVRAQYLRDGRVRSCGCYRSEQTSQRSIVRLEGQRFGRLTVQSLSEDRSGGQVVWLCSCSCGRTLTVRGKDLRSGHSQSCGCLASDMAQSPKCETVSYGGVHRRLRAARGPAREQRCVDCSEPADDWSYDGGGADEQTERRGPWVVRFSHDLSRYVPRCRGCHNRFDHHSGALQ